MTPKYPDITVRLSGKNGNPYALIGEVNRALKAAGIDRKEVDAFTHQALGQQDYNHLLTFLHSTVNCE